MLWSNPDIKWRGFRPVPYWLEDEVLNLPLTERIQNGETPSTLGKIYKALEGRMLKPESFEGGGVWEDVITLTEGGELVVKGSPFPRQLLVLMLGLRNEGINPFETTWYYYDNPHCMTNPQQLFLFFVVDNHKIIRERAAFSDHSSAGFNPSIFGTIDHSEPVWDKEEADAVAEVRYWYRKFYTETKAGKLMALRPGNSQLFYYDRTASDLGAITRSLNTIRLLLWFLVLIAVFVFVLHWKM